jgi:hypothetical protein
MVEDLRSGKCEALVLDRPVLQYISSRNKDCGTHAVPGPLPPLTPRVPEALAESQAPPAYVHGHLLRTTGITAQRQDVGALTC